MNPVITCARRRLEFKDAVFKYMESEVYVPACIRPSACLVVVLREGKDEGRVVIAFAIF